MFVIPGHGSRCRDGPCAYLESFHGVVGSSSTRTTNGHATQRFSAKLGGGLHAWEMWPSFKQPGTTQLNQSVIPPEYRPQATST